MTNPQTPSIGRIVHINFDGWTLPAIITEVHSATCVNVTTFGHPEAPAQNVLSLVLGAGDQSGTWWWPPRV